MIIGLFNLIEYMKLFKYENYEVVVEPEALLLKPFNAVYKRDKSIHKNKAKTELGFIYYFCDPRSDYQYIIDPIERMDAIKEGEGLPDNWKPDKVLKEAMSFYESFKSTAVLLLEDTRTCVDGLRNTLKTINLEEVDDKGKPKYTINTVVSAIKQVPALARELDEAEKTLAKDLILDPSMRGKGRKTIMEDTLDI